MSFFTKPNKSLVTAARSVLSSVTPTQIITEELLPHQKAEVDSWDNERPAHITAAINNVFGEGVSHVKFPLHFSEEQAYPDPIVESHLENHGYSIDNYRAGIAVDPHGRKVKMGKALQKTGASQDVISSFANDPQRQDKSGGKDSKYFVRISHHPHDVAGMSSLGQSWGTPTKSCMTFGTGFKAQQHLPHEIRNGTHVAYLEDEHGNQLARIAAKGYANTKDHTDVIYRPDHIFGINNPDFERSVGDWFEKKYPMKDQTKDARYELLSGSYKEMTANDGLLAPPEKLEPHEIDMIARSGKHIYHIDPSNKELAKQFLTYYQQNPNLLENMPASVKNSMIGALPKHHLNQFNNFYHTANPSGYLSFSGILSRKRGRDLSAGTVAKVVAAHEKHGMTGNLPDVIFGHRAFPLSAVSNPSFYDKLHLLHDSHYKNPELADRIVKNFGPDLYRSKEAFLKLADVAPENITEDHIRYLFKMGGRNGVDTPVGEFKLNQIMRVNVPAMSTKLHNEIYDHYNRPEGDDIRPDIFHYGIPVTSHMFEREKTPAVLHSMISGGHLTPEQVKEATRRITNTKDFNGDPEPLYLYHFRDHDIDDGMANKMARYPRLSGNSLSPSANSKILSAAEHGIDKIAKTPPAERSNQDYDDYYSMLKNHGNLIHHMIQKGEFALNDAKSLEYYHELNPTDAEAKHFDPFNGFNTQMHETAKTHFNRIRTSPLFDSQYYGDPHVTDGSYSDGPDENKLLEKISSIEEKYNKIKSRY